MGLRRMERADLSGFEKESRGTMRRLVQIEREMRFMKEVLESVTLLTEKIRK